MAGMEREEKEGSVLSKHYDLGMVSVLLHRPPNRCLKLIIYGNDGSYIENILVA